MEPSSSPASGSLEAHRRDWESLAARDPLWAILTDPSKKGGRWDLAAFLATGEAEVEHLMAQGDHLGVPVARIAALDYGCGIGRLTRAPRRDSRPSWASTSRPR